MKRIAIKYHIEIPDDHIDKVCRKCQCGRRDLENDIKHMAEIAGRHRVHEFVEPFITLNQEKNKDE